MARLLQFTFAKGRTNRAARKLASEWKDRTKALKRNIAFRTAEKVQATLMENIPKGDDWNAYRASLEVVEVTGLGDEAVSFAVRANPRSRTVRNVDAPDTVLYIRSRRNLKRIKPEVQILEKYNPWTLQTLPFIPDRSDAMVISRKVKEREVEKIQRKRIADRKLWRAELSKVGKRVPIVRPESTRVAKTVPDVAFEAFRLEFGIGRKPEPHWRPGLRNAIRDGLQELKRDPRIRGSMIRPSFTLWKSWEKIRTKSTVRTSQARDYVPFQKKLGINVPK